MMYKIIVKEEYATGLNTDQLKLQTIHETMSSDKVVIARTLRAIADTYDPPKAIMR